MTYLQRYVFIFFVALLFISGISHAKMLNILSVGIPQSNHNPIHANLEGVTLNVTQSNSLSGVNLDEFDILFLDEHVDDLTNPFARLPLSQQTG